MSDIDKKKKKLAKGCSIYKLEIAYNEEEGTVEYICETVDRCGFSGPIDCNWDYLTDYFDEEDVKAMDSLYEVGEAWDIIK